MTIASALYGGSFIPEGDKLRSGTATTLGTSSTTLLNLSSTAGICSHITFDASTLGNGTTAISTLKVTVDGASERTLNGVLGRIQSNTSYGNGVVTIHFPLPIRFTDSLVVKCQASNTTNTIEGTVYYSVD